LDEERIMLQTWRLRVRTLKRESYALYLAARDPRTPWYARLVVGLVVAYAFSPIDLIPDFIPVLGLLDDLVLVPLGIALAIRLIPAPILAESRERANDAFTSGKPVSRTAAIVIVCVWVGLALLGVAAIVHALP
jgi:uncharacterized membrane protein YkvA (DUF1232 family)